MNGIKVNEETFATLNHDKQMVELFRAIIRTNDNLISQYENCEPRFKKLEKRKWFDWTSSFMGGVLGGILAAFGLKIT